ncbi:DUF4365 domain-containing protein [Oceanimonas sp. GK1]|uniref:DUF4365 domain-containing protein n=1 Tax=Oceanimonas sp. (strain GK1 / IBRC-M 10197) TaxID=511062 RepID=UPI0003114E9A|nr:DUF4365 domain-containing protein [Oceanimonas sp. GK1]
MRDLGLMGESAFTFWCAEAGLIPNGSQVDRTGWDFLVEFPFFTEVSPHNIHKAALECKVQVKATDHNKRKLSISLSNLRRLITAQLPSFFVFIEFDGKASAERVFVVHVDKELISKVLRRLHQLEQSETNNNFNKRTMTVHYNDTHLLKKANGENLKKCLLNYIGNDISEYIETKRSHLKSTGYEDGVGNFTFTTEGEEDLKTLIDISLGIKDQVSISKLKGFHTRFGIPSKLPFIDTKNGTLEMPDIQPTATGIIRFKINKLTTGLSFEAKLYNSALNAMIPDELKKLRVEGDFFDFQLNPFTKSASYSFSFEEDSKLEIHKFRNALRLLELLSSSGEKIFAEFIFDGLPKLDFHVGCSNNEFHFSNELIILDNAIK